MGIGAYQARHIARQHGGELDVVSVPGAGTTFRLRFPVTANPQLSNG
jgi:signal transduction histidine kinase